MLYLFLFAVFFWCAFGFLGVCHCKDYGRANYEMIIFFVGVLGIPFVAKFCGLM